MPHFVGFFGMYWMKPNLPLNPIIDSSTDTSRWRVYDDWKWSTSGVRNGRTLYRGSWPGSPFLYWLLSLRCRNLIKRENRSRFITCKEKTFNYHHMYALNAMTKAYAGESVLHMAMKCSSDSPPVDTSQGP